jgi:hypothetical protein
MNNLTNKIIDKTELWIEVDNQLNIRLGARVRALLRESLQHENLVHFGDQADESMHKEYNE